MGNCKIVRVSVIKRGDYKTIFTGFFENWESVKKVKNLFKGYEYLITKQIIDADDDYYLKKAEDVAKLEKL